MQHSAKALIRNEEGKILVLYRSATHPHLAHDIDLPGGEIESGERIVDGLMREIIEETGITVRLTDDNAIHSWRSTFFQEIHVLYEVRITGGVVRISWEHKSYGWMTDEEFITVEAQDEFMHKVQEWLAADTAPDVAQKTRRTEAIA